MNTDSLMAQLPPLPEPKWGPCDPATCEVVEAVYTADQIRERDAAVVAAVVSALRDAEQLPIKGAMVEGGYVIVTPMGRGNARAVCEAINAMALTADDALSASPAVPAQHPVGWVPNSPNAWRLGSQAQERQEREPDSDGAALLLRQALDALEHHLEQTRPILRTEAAIAALRAALAEVPQPAAPMTLAEQVRDAQEQVRSWSPEKRAWVQLEGQGIGKPAAPAAVAPQPAAVLDGEARGWWSDLRDIIETIELGLTRGYTPAELLDENSPIRDRMRAVLSSTPAVERVPLTKEQIKAALADMYHLKMPFNELIEAVVRATERAHGIQQEGGSHE